MSTACAQSEVREIASRQSESPPILKVSTEQEKEMTLARLVTPDNQELEVTTNQAPLAIPATKTSLTSATMPIRHFGSQILPGIGKMWALPSQEACDVDAFVGKYEEEDGDDLSSVGSYPLYNPSATDITVGDSCDDLENNGNSLPGTIIRREEVALDPHTDPFAPRVGKTLVWRNINMTLQTKNNEPNRKLLNNVWGEVPKTETTAIMGASGAGKTSLLNILAGRARTGGRLVIEADVRLNNYSVDPTSIKVRKSIAFVAQDDSLQATATPREAIRFSAKLRLPRSTTDSQLDKLASRMIHELGLSACADTIVGGPLLKGISGGERKRASVGVELVVKPAMVFLDEPTSGLDSFSAVQVCHVLKKVANAGASVLFTIHQPSSEIFSSFDHLILLQKGRVLFQGSVSSVPSYFAARGYPCPTNYNPADWVIHVAQKYPIPELEDNGFFVKDEREITEPTKPEKGQDDLGVTIRKRRSGDDDKPPGLRTQVNLLFKRELVHMYRYPLPSYARFGLTAFLSILIGTIFFKVGEADSTDTFNLQSQFGAMMILLLLALLGTAQPALLFFPEERPVFLREYSTDHYSVMSYFISRLVIEAVNTAIQVFIMVILIYYLVSFRGSFIIYFSTTYALAMSGTALAVMLGVLSEGNSKVAQQLLPLIFIPQLLFAGFFVSPDLIPKFLRWAQYVCVLTYAVRMLIVAEFHNCSDNYFENQSCQLLVVNVKADPDLTWAYWLALILYFCFFRMVALILLRKSATRFY